MEPLEVHAPNADDGRDALPQRPGSYTYAFNTLFVVLANVAMAACLSLALVWSVPSLQHSSFRGIASRATAVKDPSVQFHSPMPFLSQVHPKQGSPRGRQDRPFTSRLYGQVKFPEAPKISLSMPQMPFSAPTSVLEPETVPKSDVPVEFQKPEDMHGELASLNHHFWQLLMNGNETKAKVTELMAAGESKLQQQLEAPKLRQDTLAISFALAHSGEHKGPVEPYQNPKHGWAAMSAWQGGESWLRKASTESYPKVTVSNSLMYNLATANMLARDSSFWQHLLDDALRGKALKAKGRASAIAGIMAWDLMKPGEESEDRAKARAAKAAEMEELRREEQAVFGLRLLQKQMLEQQKDESGLNVVNDAWNHMLDVRTAESTIITTQDVLRAAKKTLDIQKADLDREKKSFYSVQKVLDEKFSNLEEVEKDMDLGAKWDSFKNDVGSFNKMGNAKGRVLFLDQEVAKGKGVVKDIEARLQAAIDEALVHLASANILIYGSWTPPQTDIVDNAKNGRSSTDIKELKMEVEELEQSVNKLKQEVSV